MKKRLSFSLVFSAFLLFALTACGAVDNSNTNSDTSSITEITSTESQSKADTLLDEKIFTEALEYLNKDLCEQIVENEKKQECVSLIDDLNQSDLARAKLDSSLCEQINNDRYKSACVTNVESILSNIENQKQEAETIQKDADEISDLQTEALDKGDIALCDKLEDLNQKNSCVYNIIANKALSQNDSSLCSQIGDPTYKEDCLNLF